MITRHDVEELFSTLKVDLLTNLKTEIIGEINTLFIVQEARFDKKFAEIDKKFTRQEQHMKSELEAIKIEIITAVSDIVGTLTDNLDDAYAPKKATVEIEKIREHLHATP